jgi:hypothetical protein
MVSDEYQAHVWKGGEEVPAGTYVRIDDLSYRVITLDRYGPLPATFDGHVGYYRAASLGLFSGKPADQQSQTSTPA